MLTDKMNEALNNQLNAEYFASYLYLAMAAYFEHENFSGFASWMKIQSQEELGHAMRIYQYIIERGGRVELKAIKAPRSAWKSPQDVFQDAYEHECSVSRMISDLVETALKAKDHMTNNFLQWFLTEQVEEESTADAVARKLKMAQGAPGALFILDQELGSRTPEAKAEQD